MCASKPPRPAPPPAPPPPPPAEPPEVQEVTAQRRKEDEALGREDRVNLRVDRSVGGVGSGNDSGGIRL